MLCFTSNMTVLWFLAIALAILLIVLFVMNERKIMVSLQKRVEPNAPHLQDILLHENNNKGHWVKAKWYFSIIITLAFFIFIIYGVSINVVAKSFISDSLTSTLIFIGLCMLILDLTLDNKYNLPIKYRIKLLWANKILLLALSVVFFILSIGLNYFNVMSIDKDSFILFIITVFSRIVFYKLIFAAIYISYTKNISSKLFSLNIYSILFIFSIVYFNVFIISPFIFTSFYSTYIYGSGSVDPWIKTYSKDISDFTIQFSKVLSSNPILRKLITIINTIRPNVLYVRRITFSEIYSVSSKWSYNNSKNRMFNIKPFKFNKSIPLYVFKPINIKHSTIINIKHWLPNVKYSLPNITQLLYDNNFMSGMNNLSSIYQNVCCKINLTCSDMDIKVTFNIKDGCLQNFVAETSPINNKYFENKYPNKSIYREVYFEKDPFDRKFYPIKPNIISNHNFMDYGRNELNWLQSATTPPKELLNHSVYMTNIPSNPISSTNEPSFPADSSDMSIDPVSSNLGESEAFADNTSMWKSIYLDDRCIDPSLLTNITYPNEVNYYSEVHSPDNSPFLNEIESSLLSNINPCSNTSNPTFNVPIGNYHIGRYINELRDTNYVYGHNTIDKGEGILPYYKFNHITEKYNIVDLHNIGARPFDPYEKNKYSYIKSLLYVLEKIRYHTGINSVSWLKQCLNENDFNYWKEFCNHYDANDNILVTKKKMLYLNNLSKK